ncbi:hypothetical protein N1851_005078 [Merluccius polli]|uniref:Uncharacterized protein n=1 Tax=Merluccius polli TaxID=89951 RepID=A0AA47N7E2_MERPO|nr:hypothetical protein N1851_005078 [Merluccius polli]
MIYSLWIVLTAPTKKQNVKSQLFLCVYRFDLSWKFHDFGLIADLSKAPEDGLPAKKVKRPKRGEANHIPDIPTGETPDKLENERLSLLTEVKKRDNRAVIKAKMDKTFSLRRQDIVAKESEINAEFMRITTVPLQPRFLASLDKHHNKLIEIIRNKGGVVREKTRSILNLLDQSIEMNQKRECLLKCLIVYLGEDVDKLIKEYRGSWEGWTVLRRLTCDAVTLGQVRRKDPGTLGSAKTNNIARNRGPL